MRKPNPGMLLLAQQEYDLVLSESIMIGDKESDIEAGERAGVGHTIRVVQEDGTRSRAGTVIKSIFDLSPLLGRSDDG